MHAKRGTFVVALLVLAVAATSGVFLMKKTTFLDNLCVGSARVTSDGFSFAGAAHLAHKTIASLHGAGSVILDTVIVQEVAEVSGSLKAKGGGFGSIKVSGSVILADTAVSGLTHVIGSLHATHTVFADIECTSNKIILSFCTADSIIMNAPEGFTEPLIVELIGTTISVDIMFNGAQGRVILQDGAAVNGKIINGVSVYS
ncbi:MAG: hypothetical protein AB7F19_06810 [Candidatus Babeliales bacterium]